MTSLTPTRSPELVPADKVAACRGGLLAACKLADGARWGLAGAIVALAILTLLAIT
ncbi:MAG: hypothetical protein ACF8R7_18605 [Phycisphaerales bacterium JB039]